MKVQKNTKQKGFTIIEVLIVLAIAGLIIAIVLVAVPQLRRNQRNEARRSTLARVSTEIDNYISNNNGKPPTADANATTGFTGGFTTRYIDTTSESFQAPNGSAYAYAIGATGAVPALDTIVYLAPGTCSGEAPVTGTNPRQFAVAVGLEGGAGYCVDNE